MTYDDWKTSPPEYYDDEGICDYCGELILLEDITADLATRHYHKDCRENDENNQQKAEEFELFW